MKTFLSKNSYLLSAALYPLSWVYYSGPNLGFLAWIAFVPLFYYLYLNQNNFLKFIGAPFFVIGVWTMITAAWLFEFTQPTWLIATTVFSETLHIWIPFLLLYFIQKIVTGFDRGLFLFPFLWVAWEWVFLSLPHTMGTHLLSYSQGDNLWLIQMADIGGMWLVAGWVMLFNVLIYLTYQRNDFVLLSRKFGQAGIKVCVIMLIPPLLYSAYSFQKYSKNTDQSIQVSIVPTQYTAQELQNRELGKTIIERTLHRNDSLAYEQTNRESTSDLYVWPEVGTSNWMNFPNITAILKQAITDWNGALITGCKGVPAGGDQNALFVSGVLISPSEDSTDTQLQYHHKTNLIAGSEIMPYEKLLDPLLSKGEAEQQKLYFTRGKSYTPLRLKTRNGQSFKTGVSICYEQWFPATWAKQVQQGAEFFVHIAAENWYGEVGYQQFMLNVNRFRAIESRRSVARSSNRGVSTFINPLGQTYGELPLESLNTSTAHVAIRSNKTFFSCFPDFMPLFSLVVVVVFGLYSLMGKLIR